MTADIFEQPYAQTLNGVVAGDEPREQFARSPIKNRHYIEQVRAELDRLHDEEFDDPSAHQAASRKVDTSAYANEFTEGIRRDRLTRTIQSVFIDLQTVRESAAVIADKHGYADAALCKELDDLRFMASRMIQWIDAFRAPSNSPGSPSS